jgi:ubiquinone/menaquinone biosynthesis C-methylase UbiE
MPPRPAIDSDAFRAFEADGWDRVPGTYDDLWTPVTQKAVEPLLDAAHVRPGVRVLDVATGPGHAAARAAARGASVIGLDLSAAMVELAVLRAPAVDFRVAPAEDLPVQDASLHAVLSSFGLGHFSQPERVVQEMARVLVPGGRVALAWWDAPERARILGIFDDAMKRAGASLPRGVPEGPPFFRYSDEASMRGLLASADLQDVTIERLAFMHTVHGGPDALWNQAISATVRMSAAIRGQPPQVRQRVRAAFDELVGAHQANEALRIPVSILIGSASR